MVEHGHPAKEVDKKAHEIYDSLGHSLCKNVVDSKNPWAMLKAECTKNKIVLIPLSHRSATKGRDEVFESDPWANWGNGKPKNSRAKKVPNKQNNAVVKVDLSFFHEDRKPVTQIDLNQLLQGHSGIHVTDAAEFGSHLPSVLKSNTSVAAAGVLIVGASLADISMGSSERIQECIVPGWIGTHTAALRAVLVNCGDKPIEIYKETTSVSLPHLLTTRLSNVMCTRTRVRNGIFW